MKKWCKIDVLIGCCVIMAILFIFFPFMMKYQTEGIESQLRETYIQQMQAKWMVQEIKDMQFGSDSLSRKLETIRDNQFQVLEQQDRLINDFRQEMNNNINKVNTWLAYAIGIMGLVGIFIPLVIQFKVRSDEKELAEQHKKELDAKMDDLDKLAQRNETKISLTVQEFKDNISSWMIQCESLSQRQQQDIEKKFSQFERFASQGEERINLSIQNQKNEISRQMEYWTSISRSLQEELDKKFSEIDKSIELFEKTAIKNEISLKGSVHSLQQQLNEKLDYLDREYQLQRLWSRFMGFSCCYEDKALKGLPDRSQLIRYIWNKVVETFSDIITKTCDKNDVDDLDRISLIMGLSIINSIMIKIKNNPDIKVYREFDVIVSEVQKLLKQMISSVDNHAVVWSISGNLKTLNQKIISAQVPI